MVQMMNPDGSMLAIVILDLSQRMDLVLVSNIREILEVPETREMVHVLQDIVSLLEGNGKQHFTMHD
jgi:hypothetical protein